MKDFARAFYKSKAWKDCRAAYLKSVGGLCERCFQNGLFVPGKIVHHKVHLTEDNINNPCITLNWDNLELVCHDCHNIIHEHDFNHPQRNRRYDIDDDGKIIIRTEKPVLMRSPKPPYVKN